MAITLISGRAVSFPLMQFLWNGQIFLALCWQLGLLGLTTLNIILCLYFLAECHGLRHCCRAVCFNQAHNVFTQFKIHTMLSGA